MLKALGQRDFALLWGGGLVSMMGNWVLFIALPFYVYHITGSALATGMMFMMSTLPRVLLGPLAGVFADRWDRKRTLVITNLLLSLILLPLLAVRSAEHLWIVYLVAMLEASIAQFVGPAEHALLPRLVGEEHLMPANALNALNNNLAMLIGPPLGGALMERLGLTMVVVVDSGSYVLAALLVALMKHTPQSGADPSSTAGPPQRATRAANWINVWREWRDGLRLVTHDRVIAALFVTTGMVAVGEGIFTVLLLPFLHVFGGGAQEFGWLATLRGVGGLLGGLIVGQIHGGVQSRHLFPLSLLLAGMLGLLMFNIPMLELTMTMLFLWGLPATGAQVSAQTVIQRHIPDQYQGRVFASYGTAAAILLLCGQGLASVFGDYVGVIPLLNIDAGLYVAAGVVALARMRSLNTREQARIGER